MTFLKGQHTPIFWGLLIIWQTIAGSCFARDLGAPTIQSFPAERTRSDGRNWQAAQSDDGRLFFANNDGLLEFDGVTWRQHRTGSTVRTLYIGNGDRIWIGGNNELGYFDISNGKISDYHSLIPELPNPDLQLGTIWQVVPIGEIIAFVAEEHLVLYTDGEIEVFPFPTARRITLHNSQAGPLISQRGVGIRQIIEKGFPVIIDKEEIGDDAINFISKPNEGVEILSTFRNGFYKFEDNKLEAFKTDITPAAKEQLIYKTIELEDGLFASSIHSLGILIFDRDGKFVTRWTENEGLLSNIVFDLFEDKDGNIWACHESGISCITNPKSWTKFNNDQGLDSGYILDINEFEGRKYAGGFTGIYELRPREEQLLPHSWDRLGENRSPGWTMERTDKGVLFCRADGIDLTSGDGLVKLFEYNQDISTVSFSETADLLYITSYKNFMIGQWVDDTIEIIAEKPFPGNMWTIDYGYDSYYYFGSVDAGLQRAMARDIEDLELTPTYEPVNNPENGEAFIWAYTTNLDGVLLAITNAGVFYQSHSDLEWRQVPDSPSDLGKDPYSTNFFNNDRAVWIAYPDADLEKNQLAKIDRSAENGAPTYTEVASDGVNVLSPLHCIFVEQDNNTAWFGGSGGIIREDLSKVPNDLNRRPIISEAKFFNEIFVDDEGQTQEQRAESMEKISYPLQQAAFEFSLPYYGTKSMEYQTRLVGFESNWSKPNSNPFKEYTNIREGDYQFEVRGIIDGQPTKLVAAIPFTVLPPWYRTALAYAVFTAIGIALVFTFVQWRTRRLRTANVALEDAVRSRTIELERMNIRLAQANTSKNRFLAHVSHEIRNPMNGIVGLAHLMIDERKKKPDNRMNHLLSTAEQLKILLDGMLDFAAIENGQVKIIEGSFELENVLGELNSLHSRLATDKGLRLEVIRHFDSCPPLHGDSGKLKQILFNLTSNAIKFTDDGSVSVHAFWEATDRNDRIRLDFLVEDTGKGIPPEAQDKIFEQFQQGSNVTSMTKGIGLGLSIADRLSKLLGGKLSLEKTDSSGTQFRVQVPMQTLAPLSESQPHQENPNGEALRGSIVLVVEDEPYNQMVVRGILENVGASVTMTGTAQETMERLNDREWDFILVDVNLPDKNGVELARDIRAIEAHKARPIIAMSAYVADNDRPRIVQAGVTGFVPKPFSPTELLTAVETGRKQSTKPPKPSAPKNDAWNALAYLAEGDPDKLRELMDELRATLVEFCDRIEAASKTQDQDQIRDILHDMTPAARMFPNDSIVSLIESIRESNINSDWDSLHRDLAKMTNQALQLSTADFQ